MATFRTRLPPRGELGPALAACVVPVYSWALIWFFQKLPAWLLFVNRWDLLGILAYLLAFALLESLILFAGLLLLSFPLPRRLYRDRFAAQGSGLVWVSGFWAAILHSLRNEVRMWSAGQFLLGLGLYLGMAVVVMLLIHRSRRVERAVRSLAERLTVFLYLYIPAGLFGLLIVLSRNLG